MCCCISFPNNRHYNHEYMFRHVFYMFGFLRTECTEYCNCNCNYRHNIQCDMNYKTNCYTVHSLYILEDMFYYSFRLRSRPRSQSCIFRQIFHMFVSRLFLYNECCNFDCTCHHIFQCRTRYRKNYYVGRIPGNMKDNSPCNSDLTSLVCNHLSINRLVCCTFYLHSLSHIVSCSGSHEILHCTHPNSHLMLCCKVSCCTLTDMFYHSPCPSNRPHNHKYMFRCLYNMFDFYQRVYSEHCSSDCMFRRNILSHKNHKQKR